jgi:hypothetical protein
VSAVQKIANEMFADKTSIAEKQSRAQQQATVHINEDLAKPVITPDRLTVSKWGSVYMSRGIRLKKNEVRELLGNNKYALVLYDRGRVNNITGRCLIPCIYLYGTGLTSFPVMSHAKIDIREAVNMYNVYHKESVNTDGMLISKGINIYPYREANVTVKENDKSVYMYNKGYMYDRVVRLNKYDARELMENNEYALFLYNKGISRNRTGNILTVSGACIAPIGVIGILYAEFTLRPNGQILDEKYDVFLIGGGITLSVGGVMLITGTILKLNSITLMKKLINTYNSTHLGYSSEFKLDFTGNGVRLGFRF